MIHSRSANAWRDAAACVFIVAYFVVWFAPGVLGGQILFVEDTASYFFASRSNLFSLMHGGEWSWWDPLPGLGLPRLANLQSGYLSPFALLFYSLPTATVFSFYPALVLSILALSCYGLFRVRGLATLPATFGALSWASLGNVTAHTQHLPFIETLVWLPVTLLAWEWYRRTSIGWWAVAAGVATGFQFIGAPQFVIYNGLVLLVWIGLDLSDDRRETRRLLVHTSAAIGIAALGVAIASWQLLPSIEFARDGHRTLIPTAEAFAGYARAAPLEVLLSLAAEAFLLLDAPPILQYGAPYPNLPNLSVVTLGFAAIAALGEPRRRMEWLAATIFLVGMMGAAGGVTTALGWVVPFADQIRAPIRMIVPAGFLLSWLAACGMHRWLRDAPGWRDVIPAVAILWLGLLAYATQWRDDVYVSSAAFEVPQVIANASPRIAVDIRSSEDMPLFGINAGLAAGVPSLLTRAALRPRNYFEALIASQHGSLEPPRKLNRLISATVLGLPRPHLPLIRSFGLETLVRYRHGRYEAEHMIGAVPRFFIAPRVNFEPDRRARWALAAASNWDPLREVISAVPIERGDRPDATESMGSGPYGTVRVIRDSPDRQTLELDSAGGVQVTSDLFYPGWTVSIDGQRAEVREFNLALRGVVVPSGSHRIEWTYRPTWLTAAWAATGVAAALVLALGLGLRRALP